VTLAQIGATAAAFGQRLPVDPPLPRDTTIGGLTAPGPNGPFRPVAADLIRN
jgi:FAD/FMN-containing dehydrogenase